MSTRSADFGPSPASLFATWGLWAVLTGGLGLILVMGFIFGPTLEPTPSAATQIGEMAGEIKRATWRSFLGLKQPEPEPVPTSIWLYLGVAGPILGVVAIVLAAISAIRRENWRFAAYATALGGGAILAHFLWWIVILFAGVMLLVAIIENIGDIFSF